MNELQTIPKTFPDVPLIFNWVENGKTPLLSLEEIRVLGFKLVVFPVSLLFAATRAMLELLEVLKQGKTSTSFASQMVTLSQFTEQIGLSDIQEMERRYGVPQLTFTTLATIYLKRSTTRHARKQIPKT